MSKQIQFYDKVHDLLRDRSIHQYKRIQGKLFTLIDGIVSDPEQRKAVRDIARDSLLEALDKDNLWKDRYISSLVFEYVESKSSNKQSIAQKPYWHTNISQDQPDVDYKDLLEDIE